MTYELIFMPEAERHLEEWKMSGQKKTLKKIFDLLDELRQHPKSGTEQVEQLKGDLSGFWSRKITKGDRLIYSIEDEKVFVAVVSLKSRYGDK